MAVQIKVSPGSGARRPLKGHQVPLRSPDSSSSSFTSQAPRALSRAFDPLGSDVLQSRGWRGTDPPHRKLCPGRRPDARRRCPGGLQKSCISSTPFFIPRLLGLLDPLSSISEAAGNHRRVRIPQAASGGRWMLRIPIQVFAGYSY